MWKWDTVLTLHNRKVSVDRMQKSDRIVRIVNKRNETSARGKRDTVDKTSSTEMFRKFRASTNVSEQKSKPEHSERNFSIGGPPGGVKS